MQQSEKQLRHPSSEEQEPAEKIQATRKGKRAWKKAPVKVPSKTQTARKPTGKRPFEDLAQTNMPPPATGNVNRELRSMLTVLTSGSNTSVCLTLDVKIT